MLCGQVGLSDALAHVKRALHEDKKAGGAKQGCSKIWNCRTTIGPIYQRLADAIGERIARGELAEGERLPPHREIARVARHQCHDRHPRLFGACNSAAWLRRVLAAEL